MASQRKKRRSKNSPHQEKNIDKVGGENPGPRPLPHNKSPQPQIQLRGSGGLANDQFLQFVYDLREILKEVRAQEAGLNKRKDLLECRDCHSYEDWMAETPEKIGIFDQKGDLISQEEFILISKSDENHQRGNHTYLRVIYSYICPACGAFQKSILDEKSRLT